MLLLTVALVIAGAILLVIGYADNSLSYIYAAIACAAVAAVILFAFTRLTRRRAVRLAGAGRLPGDAADTGDARASGAIVATPVEATPVEAAPAPADRGGRDADAEAPADAAVAVATPPVAAATAVAATSTGAPAPVDPVAAAADPADLGVPAPTSAAAPTADERPVDGPVEDRVADGPRAPTGSGAAGPMVVAAVPVPGAEAHGGADHVRSDADADADGDVDDEALDDESWDPGPVFPIEGYDGLRVSEILPLLGELEADELRDVREYEVQRKARGTLLRRIDAHLRDLGAPSGPVASSSAPIAGYGELRAAQVLPMLASLDPAQLEAVAVLERSGAARSTVLARITRLQAARAATGSPSPAVDGPASPGGAPVTGAAPGHSVAVRSVRGSAGPASSKSRKASPAAPAAADARPSEPGPADRLDGTRPPPAYAGRAAGLRRAGTARPGTTDVAGPDVLGAPPATPGTVGADEADAATPQP